MFNSAVDVAPITWSEVPEKFQGGAIQLAGDGESFAGVITDVVLDEEAGQITFIVDKVVMYFGGLARWAEPPTHHDPQFTFEMIGDGPTAIGRGAAILGIINGGKRSVTSLHPKNSPQADAISKPFSRQLVGA